LPSNASFQAQDDFPLAHLLILSYYNLDKFSYNNSLAFKTDYLPVLREIELRGGEARMKARTGKHAARYDQKGKTGDPEKVHGDQVGGDIISVGNISDSQGVAIGRGAQVKIQSGIDAKELSEIFSTIYQKIESRPPDPLVEKEEIVDQVKRIENEVAAGEKAEPTKVERWLKNLAAMAPDILDVTVAALTNPIAGISMAIRKIAQKVKEEVR
jgi:uncharacterized protein associated with vWA-MoxR-VMAP ternary system